MPDNDFNLLDNTYSGLVNSENMDTYNQNQMVLLSPNQVINNRPCRKTTQVERTPQDAKISAATLERMEQLEKQLESKDKSYKLLNDKNKLLREKVIEF